MFNGLPEAELNNNLGLFDVAQAYPTSSGHSTRDAILYTVNQGLQTVAQIFGKNNRQFQPAPYVPGYNAGAYSAGADPGASSVGASVGAGAGSFVDGVVNWVRNNTGTAALIGAGVFLLFREPPRRR